MSTRYRIGPEVVEVDTPEFEPGMEKAYTSKERPMCLCTPGGVPMYIAKVAGKFVIKRMPNSGEQHSAGCDSYEPPAELSGLGQVLGTAIEENVDDGITALKLGFSLTKGGTRATPTPSSSEADSVKTDGNKLTLRGALHYLWEQAGFNRWTPGMEGKRTWYVIRKFLMRASMDKRAKGQDLAELLYVPEPFKADDKDNIQQRRHVQFSKIAGAQKIGRRLNLVIGEVKEITQSRYGHKVMFKHAPDCSFMVNEDLHKRLMKRFAVELGLWDAADDVHLVMIATFSVGITGVPSLEEVSMMTTDLNWIPVETMSDKMLLAKLVQMQRRFVKGLRYNLPSSAPLAAAVLSDTEPKATALYIVPPVSEDEYTNATQGLIEASSLDSWLWRAGEQEMPLFPAPPPPMPAYLHQGSRPASPAASAGGSRRPPADTSVSQTSRSRDSV